MKLATAQQIRAIDQEAQERFGIPAAALMERAGLGGWQAVLAYLTPFAVIPSQTPVAAVSGKGNNGGDALVMARCAAECGFPVTVVLGTHPDGLGALPAVHLRSLVQMGVRVVDAAQDLDAARLAIEAAALVIDGIAGSGISGALRPPLDTLARSVANHGPHRIAVDVPSGVSDECGTDMPTAAADLTLAMGLPQRALFSLAVRPKCGAIVQVDVGFPDELTTTDAIAGEVLLDPPQRPAALVPQLESHLHKHARGVVTVLAGSRGGSGAAVLAAEAAQRARAGLVHLVVDAEIHAAVSGAVSSVMVHASEEYDTRGTGATVLIGPGWGTGLGRAITLSRALIGADRGVLDADALNILAEWPDSISMPSLGQHWVLTPHVGELARLMRTATDDVRARFIDCALECSARFGATVVAKSHVVVVARPGGEYLVVDGNNAALGTAGSGDVLAGIIAGLLAAGCDGRSASRAGVLVHQEAGRRARRKHGLFAADQLIPEVGRLLDNEAI